MAREIALFLGHGESFSEKCDLHVRVNKCHFAATRTHSRHCCTASARADRPSQLSHEAQEQGQECWRRRRAQEARRYWDSRPARFEKCEDPCCRHWSSGARHTGERHGARAPYSLRPRTWHRATVASMPPHAIAADPRAWPRAHCLQALRPRTHLAYTPRLTNKERTSSCEPWHAFGCQLPRLHEGMAPTTGAC